MIYLKFQSIAHSIWLMHYFNTQVFQHFFISTQLELVQLIQSILNWRQRCHHRCHWWLNCWRHLSKTSLMTSLLRNYKSSRVKQQFDSIHRALQASLRTPASSIPHDFQVSLLRPDSLFITHNLWLIKDSIQWKDWWTDKLSKKTHFISKDTFQNDMFLTFLTNWSWAPHIDPLNLWNCFHINSFVHFVIHTEWWYLKFSKLTC